MQVSPPGRPEGRSFLTAGRVLHHAADLVLGAGCPSCGRPGMGACARCVAAVEGLRPFLVDFLPPGLPPVVAAGLYSEELRAILLAAKERGALGMLPLLGARLAASLASVVLTMEVAGPLVLLPIPSAPDHVAERGVDLTASLATGAARRLRAAGVEVGVVGALRLVRRPRDQAGLGRADRLANLAGAFRVARRLPRGTVVLVDDIVTTGATLVAAACACSDSGRPPLAAATVAATRRRRP